MFFHLQCYREDCVTGKDKIAEQSTIQIITITTTISNKQNSKTVPALWGATWFLNSVQRRFFILASMTHGGGIRLKAPLLLGAF